MDLKQMKRISIVWGLLLVLIVIGLTAVGFLYKSKSSDYKKLESELVNLAEKYVEAKFLYPEGNESLKITLDELKEEGYLQELKKDEDTCDGYVILSHKDFAYDYKGYIKCSKYTTKDYKK